MMSQIKLIIFYPFSFVFLFSPPHAEYLHLLNRCSFEILTTFSFQVRRSSHKSCRCNPFCSSFLFFLFSPHHAEYFHLLYRCSFEILTKDLFFVTAADPVKNRVDVIHFVHPFSFFVLSASCGVFSSIISLLF